MKSSRGAASAFNGKKFRIFVLGAGFSRAAGLPLGPELWREIRRRVALVEGRAEKFQDDVASYLAYRRACDDVELKVDEIDFEDFMAFLDVEHFLGTRGSDTWSADGNETTVAVKTLIGEILTERMPNKIPELYLRFAKGLRPDDYVLTFNYDVLLERALEAAGTPFRLFPSRLRSDPQISSLIVDDSRNEVIVLKLHGSIDWFDRTLYAQREQWQRDAGLSTPPSGDPIFPYVQELGVTKLLEGARYPDDPLQQMYRVRDIKQLYSKKIMFFATPWLLAPSTAKLVYASRLREFWFGIGAAGAMNFGLTIIGYSLPPQDNYARQILYRMTTNYQQVDWKKSYYGLKKQPLLIIDYCPTTESLAALKARYRFVNWKRAILHTSGLDGDAVDLAVA